MEWGKGRREKYSFKFLERLKHVLGSESWVKASCPFHHGNGDVWHRYGNSSDPWKWLRQRINSASNLAHVEDWAMQVLHSWANENWTSQNLFPSVRAGHLCPFSGLSVSSSPAGKQDPTNYAATGNLLGKTVRRSRFLFYIYLLVLLIDQKGLFTFGQEPCVLVIR